MVAAHAAAAAAAAAIASSSAVGLSFCYPPSFASPSPRHAGSGLGSRFTLAAAPQCSADCWVSYCHHCRRQSPSSLPSPILATPSHGLFLPQRRVPATISAPFYVSPTPRRSVTVCSTPNAGAAGKSRAKLSGTGAGVATRTRGRRVRKVDKTKPKEGGKDTDQGSVESKDGSAVSPIAADATTKFPTEPCIPSEQESSISVRTLYQNGDPLGKKELGKCVVRWITHGMRAMAADFAAAEARGDFTEEVRQRMGFLVPPLAATINGGGRETAATETAVVSASTLVFIIQAQPYLNAVPMPKGVEALCLKACTHYPTLFDHFQRELRDALLDLQRRSLIDDWRATESWKLLKEFAASAQHRAVVRKPPQRPAHSGLGLSLDKAKMIQARIDDFATRMSDLLRIERDAELEFTQEELDAISTPEQDSDTSKPIEFLVSHGKFQHEQCDTICNLNAISSSIGLGGMHLVMFRVEGNHLLPPTTFSPGDHVCVRICDNRGAGATSSMQGFINSLGEDGCSITVALESRHGDPTFSKLFGKSVRIDRIHGLADALTYERNCEALMLLQKHGLQKKNPSISVVGTLFGDTNDVHWLEENKVINWRAVDLDELVDVTKYDESQLKALALGLNRKRPLLVIQGPPGTGKTGLLKELITLAVYQGERVLVTAPTNTAVDNMVEKLSETGLSIVRVGNPARISATVASKSLGEIVNAKLANFKREFERKKADLRKDLRHCLKDDSLAAGIRQLLKQLGKTLKKKEKETIKEVLSNAQVVLSTNTSAADPLIRRLECFDLVVIDEAGQAIEPSSWIPILQGKRCILAGDQCQLAPVVLSRKALQGGLGNSLLARALPMHDGLLAAKLTTQYRMNDTIASWASKEMYNGFLRSSSIVSTHLLVDSPFVKANWMTQCPLLLLDTRMPFGSLYIGCEERLDPAGTGSLYNEGEAEIVVQHVLALIYSGVPPIAIAVQSPYVAQVQLLREKFNDLPEACGVEVATIDSFQGREADAVVISMDFDDFESELSLPSKKKSQLDAYLDEPKYDRKTKLDILNYWNANKFHYPELASMARDGLAIPISTIAPESTFSTSGRVLDKHRSSLKPNVVEAIICTRDWLYDKGVDEFSLDDVLQNHDEEQTVESSKKSNVASTSNVDS